MTYSLTMGQGACRSNALGRSTKSSVQSIMHRKQFVYF